MLYQKFIWPALALVGVLAGALTGYLTRMSQQDTDAVNTDGPEQVALTATDSFSIRFFKEALNETKGNVLTAPHSIADALLAIRDIVAGESRNEIEQQHLTGSTLKRYPEPLSFTLLAVDINVPREHTPESIIVLPFSENFPTALSLFNGLLAQGSPDAQVQFATSDMCSTRTKLLGGCVAYHLADWDIPFRASNSRLANFDCSSGAYTSFTQMRSRGAYRTARAADGSWEAVALMQKQRAGNIPLAFIGILPGSSAREFAHSLTPERITEIRQALAAAKPEDTLVELPRQEYGVRPHDLRHFLRQLGIRSVFDSTGADFSPLAQEKIHLSGLIHSCSISLTETHGDDAADPTLEQAARRISFTRPFIWLITDLSSNTPIDFIGLIEEL